MRSPRLTAPGSRPVPQPPDPRLPVSPLPVSPQPRRAVLGLLRVVLQSLVLLALVPACTPRTEVRFDSVVVHPLVAHTGAQQAVGLQNHPNSDIARGMLFVWTERAPRPFVIKRVPHALDLVYMDDLGRVVDIGRIAPEGPLEYTSPHAARYVLEIEAGWAQAHGVEVGDVADLTIAE